MPAEAIDERVAQVLSRLQRSKFRSGFRLQNRERAYLKLKGLPVVAQHAADFISQRLAPQSPRNDGKQTPWRGHPVFVAQHATATCCRSCLEKWHGIARGKELSEQEQQYAVHVIVAWLGEQENAAR